MDQDPDEISLQEIATALWARRTLILLLTLMFTAAAVTTAFLLPVKYQATALLSPVDSGEGGGKLGGAGGLLSQFGGLAALGGISLGGGGEKDESIATLQSAALTEAFIADRKLLPVLFPRKWDAARQTWNTSDPDEIPTLWKAEQKFRKKVRSVDIDKKTGLVSLTIEWSDPKQAAEWANELVQRTNRTLRDRAIEISERNLDYLNGQISKTSVVELRQSLYTLIETEIKKVMIAQGSEEYAFRVIDPARVAEERSSPRRALITLVGAFAGLMLGIVIALALPQRRS
jgi:uncharacterized protein involved in exopolysaccharide biosynthesis